MRVTFPSGTRNIPQDRNPTVIAVGSLVVVPGVGTSTIATYTTPANRRALVSVSLNGQQAIASAAGQNGRTFFQHSGDASASIMLESFGVQPQGYHLEGGQAEIYVLAGQTVTITVDNTAGAGSWQGSGSIKGVEYDV